MSDENDNLEDSSELGSDAPLAGLRLAEARREQQIPVIEIAKELHLDEYKVRAMERNDFEVIGAPVFAKGHLRKFAQLVGVSEADVMADYYTLERSAGLPPVVGRKRRQRQAIGLGPWIAAILVVLLAGLAYWWLADGDTTTTRPIVGEVAPLPQDEPLATPADEIVDDSAETAADEPLTSQPATPDPEPTPVVSTASLETQMSITFLGDCWTDVSDVRGRSLFLNLGKAGRTVNLSGEAPFNVLFGDAANVRIEINGAPFAIPDSARRGRTAKLTINGS